MSTLIAWLVALFLGAYSARDRSTAATPGQLRHSAGLRGLGWTLAAGTLDLVYHLLSRGLRDEQLPLILLVAVFGLGSAALLLEAYGTSGSFDAGHIVLRTAWTGRKSQRWSDLVSAHFRPQLGWYALIFRDGTTIHLSNVLQGHSAALVEIERRGIEVRDRA